MSEQHKMDGNTSDDSDHSDDTLRKKRPLSPLKVVSKADDQQKWRILHDSLSSLTDTDSDDEFLVRSPSLEACCSNSSLQERARLEAASFDSPIDYSETNLQNLDLNDAASDNAVTLEDFEDKNKEFEDTLSRPSTSTGITREVQDFSFVNFSKLKRAHGSDDDLYIRGKTPRK